MPEEPRSVRVVFAQKRFHVFDPDKGVVVAFEEPIKVLQMVVIEILEGVSDFEPQHLATGLSELLSGELCVVHVPRVQHPVTLPAPRVLHRFRSLL